MTPEQRYRFDVTGYLHLENVLSEEELSAAQDAVKECVDTPADELPAGISSSYPGTNESVAGISNGFSFHKSLEALTVHPKTWPIIKEFTENKPRFDRGTLAVNTHQTTRMTPLHCAREDFGWPSTRYECRDGRIFCDTFVVFVYLSDVFPGDGGLIALPGSHKTTFDRPANYFFPDPHTSNSELHPAVVNITPRAGDVVIISELLTHGALVWQPTDRERWFLILRYNPQYFYYRHGVSDEVLPRLSPEVRELIEFASFTHTKEIAKQDVITLS